MFENVIQASADLAKHVAAHDFGYDGDEAKEAVRTLGGQGVIDEGTTETLVAAIGFRNVLAHEYGTVDYDQVYDFLQDGLEVYDRFSQQVAQWARSGD